MSLIKGNPEGLNRQGLAFGKSGGELVFDPQPVNLGAQQVEYLLQRERKKEAIRAGRRGPLSKARKTAEEMILEALADGPQLRALVRKQVHKAGISASSFCRAVTALRKDGKVSNLEPEGDPRYWPPWKPGAS